ncbi:sister chromatid cohesion protein PDS5 homolog A [Lates japonicus]|uniref:Sister chromatid cohesion protein PDS5 homolog A n=1 Tax=Lates japonicus TaxID=270547 RepID=A0AAD3RGB1_LATJO|nr:sister chromatid cohesion protein PDS5 homolog A [Lates japonicus]
MEGDGVTQELLDTILINLIPAHKVFSDGQSQSATYQSTLFDLIQELFAIDPMLLTSVMPQLEFKLKSNDGEERLAVVRLLAKLFGAKDSELASQNSPLWQCFLGRAVRKEAMMAWLSFYKKYCLHHEVVGRGRLPEVDILKMSVPFLEMVKFLLSAIASPSTLTLRPSTGRGKQEWQAVDSLMRKSHPVLAKAEPSLASFASPRTGECHARSADLPVVAPWLSSNCCCPWSTWPSSTCAKDPVKERRAHARQCLLKNISVRREYIKQNPLAHGEKLVSLLPEYVVPYMIHLLAHDPDFTKPHEYEQLKDIKECLWFMLEVLMTKNENNSHAFLRKMVENIKQTKDAQCPDDAKANEKLYIVCDVALFVIANKSTACHLDSPKDPVLPSKFFLIQDKDFKNDKEYLLADMRQMLLTGKPKPAPVLGAVNKPLTVPGRRIFTKTTTASDTASNTSTNSSPLSSSTINKNSNSNVATESSESRAQENNENPVIKNDEGKKEEPSQNATPDAGTEASPVKRRGRPPKTAAAPVAAEKEGATALTGGGGAGRGRKRAADPNSNPSAESINIKMSKQQQQNDEGTKRQIDLQR